MTRHRFAYFKEKTISIRYSVWFFPLLLLLAFLLLVTSRISGTSVGHYHDILYGNSTKDPSLITGEPRTIRSDEWGVNTPLTVSQAKEGFPVISHAIGHGQDVAITFDVPYKDWSTLFKPQNWSFFILPLEYAFAAKWWLLAVLLILSCYTFTLTLLPDKRLIASLLSIALFFSPFVQWWYQAGSILAITYALFIAALVIRILKSDTKSRVRIVHLAGLGYALTCFAFIGYVPFLVPLALAVSAFVAGHIVNDWAQRMDKREYIRQISLLGVPIVLCSILFLVFLHQHSAVVQALSSSVYPGNRTEASGGYSLLQLLGGYYNIQLQQTATAAHLNFNQSEASNFPLISLFLLPTLFYFLARGRNLKKTIDWRVVLLVVVLLIILIRLFVPASEILFNALQLNRIPHNRILIGVGLVNIFLLVMTLQNLTRRHPDDLPLWLRIGSSGLAFLTVLAVGLGFKLTLNGYLENKIEILIISSVFAGIVWLLLQRQIVRALAIFALFSMLSTYHVNPLYRGLGIINHSKLSTTLQKTGSPEDNWIVGDNAASFETIPAANGLHTLSGVYAYPQLGIWREIGSDKASQDVYNRYAHVFFSVGELSQKPQNEGAFFDPPALDAFRVHADSCSEFLQKQHVRYVLMTETLVGGCAKKIATIPYPLTTFYIYELSRN